MDCVIKYNYDLDYNKEDINNQILLWKSKNYNCNISDFDKIENKIKFTANIEENEIKFTYLISEKTIHLENINNYELTNMLSLLNTDSIAEDNLYKILSAIESFIDNLPNYKLTEEIILDSSDTTSDSSDSSDSSSEVSSEELLTKIDSDFLDDKIKIKIKSLSNIESDTETISDQNYNNITDDNNLQDIISTENVYLDNSEEDNINDPYSSLILSDSEFQSFYKNLNLEKEKDSLNENEILKISTIILEKETKITDPDMLKYSFNNLAIIKMIIKEVIKLRSLDGIEVYPDNNNIFRLNIKLDKFKNKKLLEDFEKYKEINPNFDCKVHLTIDMPKLYYPYAPPVILINEPKFSDIFLFSIESLEYFKQEYWNPSNTLEHTLNGLINIIDNHGIIDSIIEKDILFDINNNIIKLWSLLSLKSNSNNIKIEFTKLTSEYQDSFKTNSMATGIGYSNDYSKTWNVKKFLSEKKNKSNDLILNLKEISNKLNSNKLPSIEFIQNKLACILDFYLYDVNIFEITNKIEEYEYIISILLFIQPYYEKIEYNNRKLSDLIIELVKTVNDYIKMTKNNDNDINTLCQKIINLDIQHIEKEKITVNKNSYDFLKEYQFNSVTFKSFSFKDINNISSTASKRIIREFSSLQKSLPFNYETSIFLRYDENNMNKIKFMIIGPKDTPYQDGCYIFDMILPETYPTKHPSVNFLTTGKGTVRFNPNLYNCGKVCLSLLGTWQGESWNENSTILQVLVSIQSLILIDHPYFNEPGYQSSFGTASGMNCSKNYNKNIQYNNIKWAIVDNIINPPPEFEDIIKIHFSIKKNEIIKLAEDWSKTNSNIQNIITNLNSSLTKL